MVLRSLTKKAREQPKRIGFPERDERIEKAIRMIRRSKTAIPTMIGTHERYECIDTTERMDELIRYYREKGADQKQITNLRRDPVAQAMILLDMGELDAVISGAIHSTAHTLRNAFSIIGMEEGVKRASSFFIMDKHATRVENIKILSDCAVQVSPDAKELAEIAVLSARTARGLGLDPRVALLSFSTKGSAKTPETQNVRKATTLAKRADPSTRFDGELQLDAALDPHIAERKGAPELEGAANVLIFPDLNSGNIGYKIMRMYGRYDALGPFLQGLRKPVIDLSRSVSVQEIHDIATVVSAIYP